MQEAFSINEVCRNVILPVDETEKGGCRNKNNLVGSLQESPAGTYFINHFHQDAGFRIISKVAF